MTCVEYATSIDEKRVITIAVLCREMNIWVKTKADYFQIF